MPELKLDIMKSVSHTSMTLNNMKIMDFQLSKIPAADVRRMIRKFGILERSLILEAFLSYLLYAEKLMLERGREIPEHSELAALASDQSEATTKQAEEALNGDRIVTENIPFGKLLPILDLFKKGYSVIENSLTETERLKLSDIFLFNSLK